MKKSATKFATKLRGMNDAIESALQRWIVAGEYLDTLLKRKEQFLKKNTKKGRIK